MNERTEPPLAADAPTITWKWLSFSQLSAAQLYEVLQLRAEVFVVEQQCVFNDLDGFDADAFHLLGYVSVHVLAAAAANDASTSSSASTEAEAAVKQVLVAYARTYGPDNHHVHSRVGTVGPECSIGRVVTHHAHRRNGYGKQLMQTAIDWCVAKHSTAAIRIGAQRYLRTFYGKGPQGLGFEEDGRAYDEDGIPHIDMLYTRHLR